ncbi:hypothetical protein E2562_019759 [Oryza meyeriana var. granulata]|uniref:SprT-like domain-containing protein n=1 Tax=Oryza meyeriana var. granulata TaxID=110450 RepID=A0A6G1DKF0_9ORYZ|nr:hypothetical protein E2562_019759 [Oryza meyeriana var. granulata]
MDWVADPDLEDPNPDAGELFRHYDGLYFRGALAGAGFSVQWSSPPVRMVGPFGSCTFRKPDNTITLSEPVLKYRSSTDMKNALLHQMIHAILFVKHQRKDCRGHGPIFRAWMTAINSCSVDDHQRPPDGYNITTRHDFSPDTSTSSLNGSLWKCEYCGDTLVRAMNMGAPSDASCIENVDNYSTCGNMLCHWHNHMMDCGGTYTNMGKATWTQVQNNVQGKQHEPADIPNSIALPSVSKGKPNRQNEVSSSSKAGMQDKPRDTQKTIDLPASPQTKLKQPVLQKEKRQCKTRKSANEKFAVISAWLNYYESEGSSGSTEPLVNKRTERRRVRNRITYTWSRKRNAGGSSSIKSQPSEDGSSQAKAAAPCLDIVASTPSEQVVNKSPGYHSQSPASYLAIIPFDTANEMVPLQSADPPSLTAHPTITSGIIYISDDD